MVNQITFLALECLQNCLDRRYLKYATRFPNFSVLKINNAPFLHNFKRFPSNFHSPLLIRFCHLLEAGSHSKFHTCFRIMNNKIFIKHYNYLSRDIMYIQHKALMHRIIHSEIPEKLYSLSLSLSTIPRKLFLKSFSVNS